LFVVVVVVVVVVVLVVLVVVVVVVKTKNKQQQPQMVAAPPSPEPCEPWDQPPDLNCLALDLKRLTPEEACSNRAYERTCDDDSLIKAAMKIYPFEAEDADSMEKQITSIDNDCLSSPDGSVGQHTSQIKAVLAEVCAHFEVEACALVTPSGISGYRRIWHVADGSGFHRPRGKQLRNFAFFGITGNHEAPLIVQDAMECYPTLRDSLKTPFHFYAEAVVRGRSSGNVLGTLCLADGMVFDLDYMQRGMLRTYADILYEKLLEEANLLSESDDFMLPHLTYPSTCQPM